MSDEELNELEHAARTSVAGGLAWRLGKALASVRAERDEQESEKNAERDALREQLAEVREALEPFAKWCDEMEFECPILRDDARVASDITMADVRRARDVLDKIKGGGDE